MASSSQPTTESKAASRGYRLRELLNASIDIGTFERRHLPEHLEALLRRLISGIRLPDRQLMGIYLEPHDLPFGMKPIDLDEPNRQNQEYLFDHCQRFRKRAVDLTGEHETKWWHLVDEVLSLLHHDEFTMSEDLAWVGGAAPPSAEYISLSIPKADLALGPPIKRGPQKAAEYFSEVFLTELEAKYGLHPRIAGDPELLSYPFLILECNSDTQSIYYAENQAAGGAARALYTIEELAHRTSQCDMPPVFVVATEGPRWIVYLAFKELGKAPVHLVDVWDSNIRNIWSGYTLLCVLTEILEWGKTEYSEYLKASFKILQEMSVTLPVSGTVSDLTLDKLRSNECADTGNARKRVARGRRGGQGGRVGRKGQGQRGRRRA